MEASPQSSPCGNGLGMVKGLFKNLKRNSSNPVTPDGSMQTEVCTSTPVTATPVTATPVSATPTTDVLEAESNTPAPDDTRTQTPEDLSFSSPKPAHGGELDCEGLTTGVEKGLFMSPSPCSGSEENRLSFAQGSGTVTAPVQLTGPRTPLKTPSRLATVQEVQRQPCKAPKASRAPWEWPLTREEAKRRVFQMEQRMFDLYEEELRVLSRQDGSKASASPALSKPAVAATSVPCKVGIFIFALVIFVLISLAVRSGDRTEVLELRQMVTTLKLQNEELGALAQSFKRLVAQH